MLDIVLVDDHKLVREGIKGILERGSEFRVVGEAESGADAVSLCQKTQPHIALMGIGLPGMNGIEATAELQRHCPAVKVVIFSMYEDENSVVSAIRSGARAFVLKKASSAELLDALRTVDRPLMPNFIQWQYPPFPGESGFAFYSAMEKALREIVPQGWTVDEFPSSNRPGERNVLVRRADQTGPILEVTFRKSGAETRVQIWIRAHG